MSKKLDDSLYALKGTATKRVRDAAIRTYLDFQKMGKPIPQPLQDYINWGLQRTLDDERTPFPVTKRDKHNPYLIFLSVKIMIELKGRSESQAIDDVAGLYALNEKSVKGIYNKLKDDSPEGIIYYLSEIW